MPVATYTLRLSVVPVDPTRIEVRSPDGKVHATVDVPTGFLVREVPSPWWVRARHSLRRFLQSARCVGRLMDFDAAAILAEVRARSAALAACPGHRFVRVGPAERQGTRTNRCTVCHQLVDASYAVAYHTGLQHAAKGHRADDVFPSDTPAPG